MPGHNVNELRDRIDATLRDYWPGPLDAIQEQNLVHCREQLVAELSER
jgi:hypothetical protein